MRLVPGRLWFDPKLRSWISFFGFFSQVVHLERKGLKRKASGIDYKHITIVIDDSRVMPQFGAALWRLHLLLQYLYRVVNYNHNRVYGTAYYIYNLYSHQFMIVTMFLVQAIAFRIS